MSRAQIHGQGDRASAKPWVRSGTILAIVDFLERHGRDPEKIFGPAGLRMVETADPYRRVDLKNIMAILQVAADKTGHPDIGLELGLSLDLKRMGPFGFMFLNAPTIGDALSGFARYGFAFQSHAHFALAQGQYRVALEYASNQPEMPGWAIDSELAVGSIMASVSGAAGRRIVPNEIHFDHEPICTARDYSRWLSVRPVFGSSMNRVYYPLELFDEPIAEADPLLHSIMQRHVEDLAQALSGDDDPVVDIITNNVRRGLSNGTATLEHVACELGMAPRTLQRRLLQAGTSFQTCSDEVRLELAIHYLEKTALDLAQIAWELGYADSSVFSRAFKRWTGLAPGSYRQQH